MAKHPISVYQLIQAHHALSTYKYGPFIPSSCRNKMPAIQAPATVLVTGANGFIAAWIVKYLLENGYSVRGTVRNKEKAAYFTTLYKDAVDSGRLEYCTVPDFLAPGAFDEAVKGVDAIIHTATPVTLKADDPEGKPHL